MTTRFLAPATLALLATALAGLAAWSGSRGTGAPGALPVLQASAPSTESAPRTQRAPYDPGAAARLVAFWQGRVRYDPEGAIGLGNLAGAYMALQRESGDIGYALKAEAAARRSLRLLPWHAETRRRLSRILLTQHRFGEALDALKNAAPTDADAQRLKADILIELGDYKGAEHALSLSPPAREDPNYYSLRARLLEVHGQALSALADVRTARAQAEANTDASPESIAWYHWREARVLASLNRYGEATARLKKALEIFPRDYRVLNALGHAAANQGDWKGAADWARQASAIVPELDTVTLLGDAYAALGQKRQAAQQFAIVEAISRLARARGVIYDRQRALFYADHDCHLDEAVSLARGGLRKRRDIYAYDTLAWAAYKKGLLSQARRAAARATAYNTRDASLWYHAGMIAWATGQQAQARRDLEKALAINPRFHPTAPRVARATLSKISKLPSPALQQLPPAP